MTIILNMEVRSMPESTILYDKDEMFNQAENYEQGINGYKKDQLKAFQIYKYLSNIENHVLSQYKVGNLYLSNTVSDYYQPTFSEVPLLSSIIEQLRENYFIEDNREAGDVLTKILKDNFKKAKFYLEIAANNGNKDASFALGEIYMDETYGLLDFEKAKEYFVVAAEKNHISAKTRLGEIYALGRDLENAVKLYQESAEQGCCIAMLHLGNMYKKGEYFEKNKELSMKWLLKSSELKHPKAQYLIALNYLNEDNEEAKNKIVNAANLFLNSAEQGYPRAQNMVGLFYYNGIVLKKDFNKAREYFTKATNQCHPDAQFNLAKIFQNGDGVTKNLSKAIVLYTKASQQGHLIAKLNLGKIYYEYHKRFKQYLLNGSNAEWVKNFCQEREKKWGFENNSIMHQFNSMVDLEIFQTHIGFLAEHYLELEKKWGLSKELKKELDKNQDNNWLKKKIKL